MEKRTKGMPRWQYEESLLKEKLINEKSLEQPQKSNLLEGVVLKKIFDWIGSMIVLIIVVMILAWFLSGDNPGIYNQEQDVCDGSSRSICP